MPDILHDFSIRAQAPDVYDAIVSPIGLDSWWTRRSSGSPVEGAEYQLFFGPGYDWRAVVIEANAPTVIAWKFTRSEPEWLSTTLRFTLTEEAHVTRVRFSHTGWPEAAEHFRISSYCWAMYLRLLKRYVETGDIVSYEDRLDA